jgi:hypothetical protein
MSEKGRTSLFRRDGAKVRSQRNLVVAARSGEGPLTGDLPIFVIVRCKTVFVEVTGSRPGEPPKGKLDRGEGRASDVQLPPVAARGKPGPPLSWG